MNWFTRFISWLKSFWDVLPDKTKEKIVDTISETFRFILEKFYESFTKTKVDKKEKTEKENKNTKSS